MQDGSSTQNALCNFFPPPRDLLFRAACSEAQRLVERESTCTPGGESGGPGLAVVLCTGAALRRPSVWPVMRRKEGCFSPAVGSNSTRSKVAWNDPASGDPPSTGSN